MVKKNKLKRVFYHWIAILLIATMTAAQPALAANFVVINENPSGPGSLRQAVLDAEANGNPGEVDTITFDPGVSVGSCAGGY